MTTAETQSHLWPGVPFAFGSALLFGLIPPLSKVLLGGIDPWLLAALLYLGAGLGLGAIHLVRSRIGLGAAEAPMRRADLPWLAAVIAIGGGLAPVLLVFGLTSTTAATGSLLLNLEGVMTMVIAWVVFRENVDRGLIFGAAAILLGAVVLSWTYGALSFDLGGLLIAGACLCWGIDNNLTRKLSSADPVRIAMLKGAAAGLTNLVLALLLGATLPAPTLAITAAVVGFLGIGLSLVLFILALRHLGTARTGAYFSLAPFIGAALSVIVLGETMTIQFVIAGVLMAIGVWLYLSERHEHDHSHEPIEHEHRHVHDAHHQHAHDGPVTEPHTHWHRHAPLRHKHPHYPDLHHRHSHG